MDPIDPIQVSRLTEHIVDEVANALGWSPKGVGRKLIAPLVRLPASRFSRLVLNFDRQVAEAGIGEAASVLLSGFVDGVAARGVATIPASGPLIIASNHPGAYDLPVILSNLPRDDVKIIASTLPLVEEIPNFAGHLIPVTRDAHRGMAGLRLALRHLKNGGAMVTFPTGIVDPDPDVLPGAAESLEGWSPSVALLLARVPDCRLVVTVASSVLSTGWLNNPLTRIQRETWRRRKLAEFFQLMQQLMFPGSLKMTPRVSFNEVPLVVEGESTEGLLDPDVLRQVIVDGARVLLREHMGEKGAD